MSHEFWFGLKREYAFNLRGVNLRLADFYTSESMGMVANELERDIHQIEELTPPPGSVFVDVGANVGAWSLYVAKRFPECQVIAIEPMPHNAQNLSLNIKTNDIHNVTVIRAAIWTHNGTIELSQNPLNSGSASIDHLSEAPKFTVSCLHADFIGGLSPYFVKMDIESAEYDVLPAITNWDKIPRMSVELHTRFGWDTEAKQKELKEKFPKVHFVVP